MYSSSNPARRRSVGSLLVWLLLVGCGACPKPAAPVGEPAESPSFRDLARIADALDGVAVQEYGDDGRPLELRWITDPEAVSAISQLLIEGEPTPGQLKRDGGLPIRLRVRSGRTYRGRVFDVKPDTPSTLAVGNGSLLIGATFHSIVSGALNRPEFASDKEARKRDLKVGDPFVQAPLIADPKNPCPTLMPTTLAVFQDDPGEDEAEGWAKALKKKNGATIVEALGINSIVNAMRRLRKACKCVKRLTLNGHGASGTFRIGPRETPLNGPTRVGPDTMQTSASTFGAAIKPYLCKDAQVRLLSCCTASGAAGRSTIVDLAKASGATVTGATASTYQDSNTNMFRVKKGVIRRAKPDGTVDEIQPGSGGAIPSD